jgi:hypothetical protein
MVSPSALAATGAAASVSHVRHAGDGPTDTASPTCAVRSAASQVESGSGDSADSVADVIRVGCQPKFRGQTVKLSSPQLYNRCGQALLWSTNPNDLSEGPSYYVVLDKEGNATAVAAGGPGCSAGTSLISAHLTVAPKTTVSTHFSVLAPKTTAKGITAVPAQEVEDATYAYANTVFQVEFPAASGDTVQVSSQQLFSSCQGNIYWIGPAGEFLGENSKSVDVTLDSHGNAFVVAEAGPSCAAGKNLVTAQLTTAPSTSAHTYFTILAPKPTV